MEISRNYRVRIINPDPEIIIIIIIFLKIFFIVFSKHLLLNTFFFSKMVISPKITK